MDGIWYYRRVGKLTGPIPFHELIEAAENGTFEADDEVRSGHSGWCKARAIPELCVALGVPAEQASNESSSTVSEPEDLPNIDEFFYESDSPNSSEWDRDEEAPETLESEIRYYCRIGGKERGPLTLEELQDLFDAGTIQIHERVRRTDSVAWVPCREISELDLNRVASIHDRTPDPDDHSKNAQFDPNLLDRFEEFDPLKSILRESEEASSPQGDSPAPMTAVSPPVTRSSEPPVRDRSETSLDPVRTPPVPAPQPMRSSPDPLALILEAEAKPPSSRKLALPELSASTGQLIFLGVAALFAVYLYAAPAGKSGVYGTVKMGEHLLPVGSVSLKSDSKGENSAMTLSIFDGEFETGDGKSLRPENYEVVVTIGNPLGMPVPQLEGTAFENLNGARYRTQLNAALLESESIEFSFSESDVELLEGNGELPDQDTPQ